MQGRAFWAKGLAQVKRNDEENGKTTFCTSQLWHLAHFIRIACLLGYFPKDFVSETRGLVYLDHHCIFSVQPIVSSQELWNE